LFGLPGLIALIAIEFASNFFDIEIALRALQSQFLKFGEIIKFAINPLNLFKGLDDLKAKFIEIDDTIAKSLGIDEFSGKVDKIINEDARLLDEFTRIANILELQNKRLFLAEKKLAAERKKIFEKEIEQSQLLSAERQSQVDAQINNISILEASEIAATGKAISNSEDRAASVKEIEFNANIERAKLQELFLKNEIIRQTNAFKIEIDAAQENSKRKADLQRQSNNIILDLNKQLFSSTEKGLNDLTAQQQELIDGLQSNSEKTKGILAKGAKFLRSVLSDNQTAFEASFDADKERSRILTSLKEAETLDATKNAAQIRTIQETALKDLENLITGEKARASTLEENSADELDARSNIINATNLYKSALDQVASSQDTLNAADKVEIERLGGIIKTRQASLISYAKTIDTLDKALIQQREIEISVNADAAFEVLDELEQRIKGMNNRINIRTNDLNNRVSNGTQEPLVLRDPEPLTRARGGSIDGFGGGDIVPALLEPGEFVIRKEAVKKNGMGFFDALNSGKEIIKRRFGGSVSKVERIRRRYQDQKENFNSQIRSSTFNSDSGRDIRFRQTLNSLFDGFIESIDKVSGKSPRDIRSVDNINNKILNASRSVRGEDSVIVDSLIARRDDIIANAKDVIVETSINDNETIDTPSNTDNNDTTLNLENIIRQINADVQNLNLPSVSNNDQLSQDNGNSDNIDNEDLTVRFLVNEESTTGTLSNDSNTTRFINELRRTKAAQI
jgi:hypothetical protein